MVFERPSLCLDTNRPGTPQIGDEDLRKAGDESCTRDEGCRQRSGERLVRVLTSGYVAFGCSIDKKQTISREDSLRFPNKPRLTSRTAVMRPSGLDIG
jgi:hypothetical protein